jgi:hypothetical protein
VRILGEAESVNGLRVGGAHPRRLVRRDGHPLGRRRGRARLGLVTLLRTHLDFLCKPTDSQSSRKRRSQPRSASQPRAATPR